MAEWLNAPVLKTGLPAMVTGVQIPPLPIYCDKSSSSGRIGVGSPATSMQKTERTLYQGAPR